MNPYIGQMAAGQPIDHVTITDDVQRTIECYAADDTLLQTITEPLPTEGQPNDPDQPTPTIPNRRHRT